MYENASHSVWYSNLVMAVMLVKHDKPTNCKEAMVDLSPRNGYEPYIILDKSMYDYQVVTWVDLLDGLKAVVRKLNFMGK